MIIVINFGSNIRFAQKWIEQMIFSWFRPTLICHKTRADYSKSIKYDRQVRQNMIAKNKSDYASSKEKYMKDVLSGKVFQTVHKWYSPLEECTSKYFFRFKEKTLIFEKCVNGNCNSLPYAHTWLSKQTKKSWQCN